MHGFANAYQHAYGCYVYISLVTQMAIVYIWCPALILGPNAGVCWCIPPAWLWLLCIHQSHLHRWPSFTYDGQVLSHYFAPNPGLPPSNNLHHQDSNFVDVCYWFICIKGLWFHPTEYPIYTLIHLYYGWVFHTPWWVFKLENICWQSHVQNPTQFCLFCLASYEISGQPWWHSVS